MIGPVINTSQQFSSPTLDDHKRFLISFLFNGSMDPGIKGSVYRAYLDLSRTVHHKNDVPNAPAVRASAHKLMHTIATESIRPAELWTRSTFDKGHEVSCLRIQAHYSEAGFSTFMVGQA
jgi:hypothetical protein